MAMTGTHLKEQHRHTAAVCSVYWGPAESITSHKTRESTAREAAASPEPEPLGHARPNSRHVEAAGGEQHHIQNLTREIAMAKSHYYHIKSFVFN